LGSQAQANLLTNASFELGAFSGDANETMVLPVASSTITGWTVVNDQMAWITAGNPWGLSAQDGDFFLDLTAYPTGAPFGGVAQDIPTVPGQQYSLSFYLGSYTQRWGGPPVSISVSAGGTSETFTVSTTSDESTWTPFSTAFTALSPNTTISLTGSAGVQYIGLDNVSVEPIGTQAIPEPATYVLICSGLVVFATFRRRVQ
jgi:hypothetical protein